VGEGENRVCNKLHTKSDWEYVLRAWNKRSGGAVIVAALLALAACSPHFDWREIANPAAGYAALFPARPSKVTRSVPHGEQSISLTLQATTVDHMTFAVGTARLPGKPASWPSFVPLFETALLHNINALEVQTLTSPSNALREIVINGSLRAGPQDHQGTPAKMRVRFYLRQDRLYEVLVFAPATAWNEEAVETFLAGFQFIATQ
jgi:hypothetical protein